MSPYLDGLRISQARWRELHPVGDLYVRDADGNRTTSYRGEQPDGPEGEPEAVAQRVAGHLDASRLAAIVEAMGGEAPAGVSLRPAGAGQDPYTTPWLEPVEHDAVDATPWAAEDPSAREGSSDPSENAATRWSAGRELPKHDPKRRSQLPVGRHSRYVKSRATAWNVTDKVADSHIARHPADCEWRQAE
jgi:hypothetical protein